MSRIDDLLRQHAPNGVEYRALRDLGTWSGGITPAKSVSRYWQDGTIPWVASMDISATAGREIRGRVTPAAIDETTLRLVPGPSIAVVMRSNVLRRFLPVGYIEVDATVNQDLRVLRPSSDLDPRYVYLSLRAASERIRTSCVRTDGSMAAVDSQAFFDWRLPVPPPEVQQEVVRTLTRLESLEEELEVALQAELQARRQQFAHYRDALLSFTERERERESQVGPDE